MKRALLPIALFALLTYCLPLVSLLVPVLADGGQSAPAAEEAGGGEGRSPAAQFLAPAASGQEERQPAASAADSEVIRLWDTGSQQVLEVPLLEFLIGAAASEMPVTWPDEALKAQAVASHSYALYQRDHASADKLEGAWFSADPARRQGYMTKEVLQSYWGEAFEENWARLESLFAPILHQVLTFEGAPAAACYHAISNGQTEASENVWNEALPYLAGVDSTLDLTAEGYDPSSLSACIEKLHKRICGTDLQSQMTGRCSFPHEIGFFLGYPYEDVIGFIDNEGENFLCSGCWKVYAKERDAQTCFCCYKNCTTMYQQLFDEGVSIECLAAVDEDFPAAEAFRAAG